MIGLLKLHHDGIEINYWFCKTRNAFLIQSLIPESHVDGHRKIYLKDICNIIPNQEATKDYAFKIVLVDNTELEMRTTSFSDLNKWTTALLFDDLSMSIISFHSFKVYGEIKSDWKSRISYVKRNGKEFVIKSIGKCIHASGRNGNKIKSERNILTRIKSPFIIKLYATFTQDESYNFVYEYVECGNLKEVLRNYSISMHQIKLYLFEIAIAILHLHEKRIIHQNLKPEHVLIAKTGHIKLTGLSNATYHGSCFKNNDISVSYYTSPEVILKGDIDYQQIGDHLVQ
ncbi:hypothetical protein TRFO_34180 [Tritrichomonas foetus]|uniref:non-specific serine/threonine protein kinase n=1 Tax=Tritrichomonas foetus TaxID=1144522 RepID=A0A1J4JL25_9EUKA|nr:hypothetical protein TRFO_34180 [Tritrichomonas foetus]|eukprot:OHS99369.1 hypothetical protein TRFO_34180 [Tritrichomonas foetus]